MKFSAYILVLSSLVLTLSCGKSVQLANFDSETWKNDKGGCMGKRQAQVESLKQQKKALKGISSNDYLNLFGAPDIQRLTARNQEYFVYFLEKGDHCDALRPVSNAKTMVVRFSAIKLATEVTFQNGADI